MVMNRALSHQDDKKMLPFTVREMVAGRSFTSGFNGGEPLSVAVLEKHVGLDWSLALAPNRGSSRITASGLGAYLPISTITTTTITAPKLYPITPKTNVSDADIPAHHSINPQRVDANLTNDAHLWY